jgi:hypothetical protein
MLAPRILKPCATLEAWLSFPSLQEKRITEQKNMVIRILIVATTTKLIVCCIAFHDLTNELSACAVEISKRAMVIVVL